MKVLASLTWVIFLVGCVSWEVASPGLPVPLAVDRPKAPVGTFASLQRQAESIVTGADLENSIRSFQRFVMEYPEHREALVALANQWLLKGTAHAETRKEKRVAFLESMRLSEAAMRTNPGFWERTASGEPPWEACTELDEEHMDAMLFWVTGVLYMFREGMVFPQHLSEVEWLDRAGAMIEHMKKVDRNWNGGAVLFSQAIIYHSVPPAAGGDPDKAAAYLNESLAVGGDWMLARWGQARYFLTSAENREARDAVLRSLLAADPNRGGESTYWRRFFQSDARRMLGEK